MLTSIDLNGVEDVQHNPPYHSTGQIRSNYRYYNGAEFKSANPMTFEGEVVILVPAIFNGEVIFLDPRVQCHGNPTFRQQGYMVHSDRKVPHSPHSLSGKERDIITRRVYERDMQFTNPRAVTRFVAGTNVQFDGPVIFKGPVTLVLPYFRQAVEFAAEPEYKSLGA
jgi:hypothetical protein